MRQHACIIPVPCLPSLPPQEPSTPPPAYGEQFPEPDGFFQPNQEYYFPPSLSPSAIYYNLTGQSIFRHLYRR